MFGVACIDEQSGIVGQAWENNSVRYVSIDEDAVITIQNGPVVGKVAISNDKTLAYGATINGANTVYVYKKSQAWVLLGFVISVQVLTFGLSLWMATINGCIMLQQEVV
ncbi:hypothetical protein NXY15_05445 [Bacteroides thetaiotaomicron]|nr:hypothetical protein NXY15_05445 [Bacteroides thetaiotaomicron]